MAIQDDIMAMLSQVSDAGDKATDRGRRGSTLYSDIARRIESVDDRKKAMREINMLGDPMQFGSLEEQMQFDPLTGDRVATIIEKYMADASDGVPADAGLLDGESPPAEIDPMMELVAGMGTPARRTPVSTSQPPPRPDFDETALESMDRDTRQRDAGLAGLLIGEGREPDRSGMLIGQGREPDRAGMLIGEGREPDRSGMLIGQGREPDRAGMLIGEGREPDRAGMLIGEGREPNRAGMLIGQGREPNRAGMLIGEGREPDRLKERLFAGQDAAGGPMSATGQLGLASTSIPLVMLPKLAAQVGISDVVVNKFLSDGPVGAEILESMIRSKLNLIPNKTPGARMRQRVDVSRQPNPNNGFNDAMNETTRRFTATGGAASGGQVNNIRDKIMNTYGRM